MTGNYCDWLYGRFNCGSCEDKQIGGDNGSQSKPIIKSKHRRSEPGWCLQYVDDAINSITRSPNAQTAYLNELNAGRMAGVPHLWGLGDWILLGFSIGPVYRRWTRVLNAA